MKFGVEMFDSVIPFSKVDLRLFDRFLLHPHVTAAIQIVNPTH
jgi:hypothetical protein